MKKPGLGAKIYVVLLLMFMYLPILVVALFSFNASTARTPTVCTGFSLQWYRQMFDDTRGFGGALKTSLLLALYSVSLSTVLGVLGAVGQVRRQYRATLGGRMRRAASNLFESVALLPVMLPEIILGVAFMLLVAAFIEAFWSSIAEVPAWTKFGVAGVLWAGVLLWLWRGGRGGGHAH